VNRVHSRFAVLDSWRGVCAIIVVVYHFAARSHLLFLPFFRNGWLFVDFFFALSGFVITHAYQHQLAGARAFFSFAIRRFGRIWPLHVAVLVPFIVTELLKLLFTANGFSADHAAFSGSTTIDSLIANIFLLQSMGLLSYASWNVPSWSISVEYWTYIVFGLAVLASSRAARPKFWSNFLLAAISGLSLMALIFFAGTIDTTVSFGIFRCLLGFIVGHFAYQLWERLPSLQISTTIEFTTVSVVSIFVIYAAGTGFAYLAPLIFGVAVFVFALEGGVLSQLLRKAPFLLLGKLSFSIYMTHWFLHDFFRKILDIVAQKTGISFTVPMQITVDGKLVAAKIVVWGGPFFSDFLLIVFLAAVIGISALTFRYIEKPGQRIFGLLAQKALPRDERDVLIVDPKPL
jgi:peptidoglycan/LPS O-acetylase OafA/YrhL